MGLVNYRGSLPVAVVLQWKGESIARPITPARANHRFVIANESVTSFALRFTVGGSPAVIERVASRGRRLFDDRLNTYTTLPVPGPDLDRLLDAGSPEGTLDLTFEYRPFFDVLLEQMTRTNADQHNLANPNDSAAILATFTRRIEGRHVRITYQSAAQTLRAVPCKLVDKQIAPGVRRPPAVKLVFELDFLTGIDDARRVAMRRLVAMDLSKLARFGRLGNERVPYVVTWIANVYAHLANRTSLERGERIRQAIVARHRAKTPEALSRELRDDIDLHIITANHWGEARESMTTERHQRLTSDLFGTLHQSAWHASPVRYLRALGSDLRLGDDETAALTLQYGAGHCGEHAATSYAILRDIIDTPGSRVVRVVLSGNANIDHAFVVYDLDVERVILTKAASPANSRVALGAEIQVWNLREAIGRNAPRPGWVMDPYLDPSVMHARAADLLAALNGPGRRARGKDTDFLAFQDEHPGGFVTDDIRSQSPAQRARAVKHV